MLIHGENMKYLLKKNNKLKKGFIRKLCDLASILTTKQKIH